MWESRWPSWAFRPNEPYGFCRRNANIEPCSRTGLSLSLICRPTSEDIKQQNWTEPNEHRTLQKSNKRGTKCDRQPATAIHRPPVIVTLQPPTVHNLKPLNNETSIKWTQNITRVPGSNKRGTKRDRQPATAIHRLPVIVTLQPPAVRRLKPLNNETSIKWTESSGAVWKSRWPSWLSVALRPQKPLAYQGREPRTPPRLSHRSLALWWPSWAPDPNKPTVSVDVKQTTNQPNGHKILHRVK